MRILFCHNYYQQAGGEDQTFADQVQMLRERGHHVVEYTRHNTEIQQMSSLEVARSTIWSRRSAADVRELVQRERPDVMHCANTFPLISPAAYHAARTCGVAVVQTLHNFRIACPKAQFMREAKVCEDCLGKVFSWPAVVHGCYRDSRAATTVVAAMQTLHRWRGTWHRDVDVYIAATGFVRDKMVDAGLPADRICVKPNFVAPDPGVRKGGGRYVVFAGRLSPEKGIDTLLAAWSMYRGDYALKIIGGGPLAGDVARAAAEDSRIQWLGKLPWQEVFDVIGGAACLVMPSVWYETFGRVIVEAYATGTPVVVSRMGAMAELVLDGQTGFLFTPGDARDLLAKVERLIGSNVSQGVWRAAARRAYEDRFTADTNYTLLMDIYHRALAHRRGESSVSAATPPGGEQVGPGTSASQVA